MTWNPVGNIKGPPGAGAEIPPGPPRTVFANDEFGIPGWMPERRVEGATAWITSNLTLSLNSSNSTIEIPFGDAEQYGQLMWDLDFPSRMYARRSGYYRITGGFSLAVGTVAAPRKMRFVRNGGIEGSRYRPYDLTGRVSGLAMAGDSAEPLDFSATSAPVYLDEGDYMEMTAFGTSSITLQAGGRASWLSMEFLG